MDRPVEMTFDARQKRRNLRYAILYNVIWANQKTGSFVYRWLRALATSFPTILSGIRHPFIRSVNTSIVSVHGGPRSHPYPVDCPQAVFDDGSLQFRLLIFIFTLLVTF